MQIIEDPIHGKVVRIFPRSDDNIVRVEVALEGDLPGSIKAGRQVDEVIEVERLEDIIFVERPTHAHAASTSSLFKLADDGLTAIRVPVKFGRSSQNAIEIVDGLKVGDKVILSDMSAYEGVSMIKLK